MSSTVIKRGFMNLSWNNDTSRTPQPCSGSCGHGTTGISDGKPYCLPCALTQARTLCQ